MLCRPKGYDLYTCSGLLALEITLPSNGWQRMAMDGGLLQVPKQGSFSFIKATTVSLLPFQKNNTPCLQPSLNH